MQRDAGTTSASPATITTLQELVRLLARQAANEAARGDADGLTPTAAGTSSPRSRMRMGIATET